MEHIMQVKRFSKKLDQIVPIGIEPVMLANGFIFIEGPVWSQSENCLYFSDIPGNTIYKWSPEMGISKFRSPSGNANGLTLDHKGCLLACEHSNRRVSRTEKNGEVNTIVAEYNGKKLNSPNDIVIKSNQILYFTDPPYGLIEMNRPDLQEQPFQGVYKLDQFNNEITLLVSDFDRPNGLVFSPDESVLYVDDSARQHVRAFDVKTDGTLENGRIFCELDPSLGEGVPDGMKIDIYGNLYVTGPGGVWVISSEGEHLGVIMIPEVTANVGWGEDGYSLFLTATSSLYRIRLSVPGRIPLQKISN